ncbi:MAG: hypothetical protein AB7I51_13675 [Methylocystis sp.]
MDEQKFSASPSAKIEMLSDKKAPSARNKIEVVGQSPEFVRAVSSSLERLSVAHPGNVQEIASSQLQLMTSFYQEALIQSRRSFNWALFWAGLGTLFFILGGSFALNSKDTATVVIPVIAGAVVQVVAGIVFVMYGKTAGQLGDFLSRLQVLQRFLLANSVCETMQAPEKDKVRADLVREIAKTAQSG